MSGARLRSCRNSNRAPARCDGPWYEVDSFRIDRAEVTVGAYRRCVEAGACSIAGLDYNAACNWAPERVGRQLERQAEHPINCVTWEQARDYCQWAGARLPTWEEWTAAARGPEGRIYVWGNEMPAHLYPALELACWRQQTSTCVVGTKSARNAPFGLQDMAGNVAEWTASAPTKRALRRKADPTMRGRNWRWSCGASWLSPMLDEPELLSLGRCDLRLGSKRDIGLGLRCAR